MNVVVIGNGVAGTLAAKAVRDLDSEASITVFAAERHPYYPRPNLIEFLAGVLGVAPGKLELVAGQTGRNKLVTVTGLTSAEINQRIAKRLSQ